MLKDKLHSIQTLLLAHRPLLIIVSVGIVLRLVFLLFGAEMYFGRANFYIGGDTSSYFTSIINLIETGTYTYAANFENGYFFRPPGYPFFIGFFYLICGQNIELTYMLVIAVQLTLDVVAIWLIYWITERVFKMRNASYTVSLLYATYPFIIVWNPILYAESVAIFMLILSLYFFTSQLKFKYILTGLVVSLACLMRPQIGLMLPIFGILIMLSHRQNSKYFIRHFLQYSLAVMILFGAWPLRNYVNYNRVIFTQDISGIGHWSEDYMSFMDYMYSIKTDYNPQFNQIIHDEEVQFPKSAIKVLGDSLKLERVIELCRTCGEGFSHWMRSANLRDDVVASKNCNTEISSLFQDLIVSQKEQNALNYYLLVPLSNLKKSLFKFELFNSSGIRKYGNLLFVYRSILLFMGLAGLFLMSKGDKSSYQMALLIIMFFISWYLYLSFIYRNIEIRYLLPVDVLLLIPAGYFLSSLKIFKRLNRGKEVTALN